MQTDPATVRAPRPAAKGGGWMLVPLVVFGAMVVLFAFALTSGDPSKLPSALIGKPVPSTTFPAVEGLLDNGAPVPGFTSADLANGKITIINFWASWCATCVDEVPLLSELKQRTGLDLYGVNYKDQAAPARRFLGRYGNPFKSVGTDTSGRAAIDWGVYGMPETFVVDGKGAIAFKHVGPISKDSLERTLLPAIAAAMDRAKS